MVSPKIVDLKAKYSVGLKKTTSMDPEQIKSLWQEFMPQLHRIEGRKSQELIALQDFSNSDPNNPTDLFDMWALTEVKEENAFPDSMTQFNIPEGLYAVFLLKGTDVQGLMTFIMKDWLPHSEYKLDTNRPHFQIMGKKYKNNHPDSEEDFYIPILKNNL